MSSCDLLSPEDVVLRPFSVGRGQSLSSGPSPDLANGPPTSQDAPGSVADPPPAAGSAQPPKDYWMQTLGKWIGVQVVPRFKMLCPSDAPGGPAEDQLIDVRATCLCIMDNKREVRGHNFRNKHEASWSTGSRWTGRSEFQIVKPVKPDGALLPSSGPRVIPGGIEGMRTSLHGLRNGMKKAQLSEPRLTQIIPFLCKTPAGPYLAEPRIARGKRVKLRASNYRLADDGLLLSKRSEESVFEDLPVVPDALYITSASTPARMSWKHLLLGAVQLVPTGHHRQAKDMHIE